MELYSRKADYHTIYLTGRNGILILQLIVYVPSLVIIFIACMRHGFRRSAG